MLFFIATYLNAFLYQYIFLGMLVTDNGLYTHIYFGLPSKFQYDESEGILKRHQDSRRTKIAVKEVKATKFWKLKADG